MNDRMSVVFTCPVTHTDRKNPFHYELKGYSFVDGFVMCDQMRSLDVGARQFSSLGKLNGHDIEEILDRIEKE